MAVKHLILLALLSLLSVNALDDRLKKCCPQGKIFFKVENATSVGGDMPIVKCDWTPEHALELYTLDRGNVSVQEDEIPICKNPEDITTVYLSNVASNKTLEAESCIDILYEDTARQSVPVVCYCRSNKDKDEEEIAASVPYPEFLNISRCCPKNQIYDNNIRNCISVSESVQERNYSQIDVFLSLLPENIEVDFLKINRIRRRCPGALFNYEVSADEIIFENGTLKTLLPISQDASKGWITINAETDCLELMRDSSIKQKLMVRVCRSSNMCQGNSCIRKCCPENSYFNRSLNCISTPKMPRIFQEAIPKVANNTWKNKNYGLLPKTVCDVYTLDKNETWSLGESGYINLHAANYSTFNYCLDIVYNEDTDDEILKPYICFGKDSNEQHKTIRFMVSSALEAISCVSLVLTLLVYACIPNLQNLHGKTLMCHAFSLLVAYSCLSINPWVNPSFATQDSDGVPYTTHFCAALGYTMLCAFLSAFSWLNVMCFDIWRTFGRLHGDVSRGRKHYKRFFMYSAYAWGLPIVITMFGLLVDRLRIWPYNLRPNIGATTCWFSISSKQFGEVLFFITPVIIQLIFNVVFFSLTVIHCSKVKAEIRRVADPSDPRSKRFHADKTKFVMIIKLFIVMGISWSAEIVSFFLNQYTTGLWWREEAFYVTDVLNSLQGLLIFILFVLKPRVYEALKRQFGWGKQAKSLKLANPFTVKKSSSNSTLTSSCAITTTPGP